MTLGRNDDKVVANTYVMRQRSIAYQEKERENYSISNVITLEGVVQGVTKRIDGPISRSSHYIFAPIA